MRTAAFAFLVSAAAFAADADWKQHSGRFATFRLPPSMHRNTDSMGIDSFIDPYISDDFDLNFDSTVRTLPPDLQAKLDQVVSAWSAQRKKDWTTHIDLDFVGTAIGSPTPNNLNPPMPPYYLYLGFSAGEQGTFAIHIYFRRLELLDDVERILRSIKLKSK